MKAIKQIIGRLIVGCVLTLGLTLNIQAQGQKSPQGAYYSAKDPDLVPLPFNPHPELPVVEVEKGVFIVDDKSIPDKPEQVVSRKLRQAAAERAKAIASDPVLSAAAQAAQRAAQEDAQQADYQTNYAPWIIPDSIFGGAPLTPDAFQEQTTSDLLTLSTNIADMQAGQHAAVSNLLIGQEIPIPQTWTDSNGNTYFFDHIMEGCSAGVKVTHNIESAQTVGAQNLWPGGSSGFSLTGTNVLLGAVGWRRCSHKPSGIYEWKQGFPA